MRKLYLLTIDRFLTSKPLSNNKIWLAIGILIPAIYTISLIASKINTASLFLAVLPAVFVSSCAILSFRDNYEEALFLKEVEKSSYLPSLYNWSSEQDIWSSEQDI
tara:strand:+ start:395 stop:712 length:318 start_codon:yes stop_codon:yes gene_type:complete